MTYLIILISISLLCQICRSHAFKGTETKRGVFLAIGPLLHLESDHAVRQPHYAFFEKVASISQDYRRNGGQRLYHREAYHH